ncbi:MAG: pyridoxal-phosphate dependent enzyme [Chloroflexota bacterium]|nr:pyridoxal-phosphate dependent enzyme [Chloroflexota bacterium]MDE3192078.1 pyridoxal-phosphate dependent enzyme [Chloroflexota bacterium]
MATATRSDVPTLDDVREARAFIAPHLPLPTPLVRSEGLAATLGLDVRLKLESLLPTSAFKVRGGVNLVGRDPTARAGIMGASTGNHGQSLAWAGRLFGVPVTIYCPIGSNPIKVASMRALGATVVEHGADYDEARVECERRAAELGRRYVHSGDEPYLIAGVATATLEVLEAWPEVDVLVVPIGGGSGASGVAVVAKALAPNVRVIGVQSEGAPAAYLSWRAGRLETTDAVRTFADGLATRTAFALPQRILRERLDDFVLVSDDDLRRAMRALLLDAHVVAEGAGAAATAGAWKLRQGLRDKRVALWVSGANATDRSLADALAAGPLSA